MPSRISVKCQLMITKDVQISMLKDYVYFV